MHLEGMELSLVNSMSHMPYLLTVEIRFLSLITVTIEYNVLTSMENFF